MRNFCSYSRTLVKVFRTFHLLSESVLKWTFWGCLPVITRCQVIKDTKLMPAFAALCVKYTL